MRQIFPSFNVITTIICSVGGSNSAFSRVSSAVQESKTKGSLASYVDQNDLREPKYHLRLKPDLYIEYVAFLKDFREKLAQISSHERKTSGNSPNEMRSSLLKCTFVY
ncbi:hypothetical protein AVEN_151730-1 [Araneus ventricosus]|uniref:Uncharacterized protein n=1 Tax=Araneus ventricosus TaxID=182803 RepID=A0A4Y2DRF5_ARAVE|nr:hypothetical protein AVEN_151730-1 [Araneus ventricosus]